MLTYQRLWEILCTFALVLLVAIVDHSSSDEHIFRRHLKFDPKTVTKKDTNFKVQSKHDANDAFSYELSPPVDKKMAQLVATDSMYSKLIDVNKEVSRSPSSSYYAVPIFLHFAKAGGTSLKLSMACLKRTVTIPDIANCTADDPELKMCHWTWFGNAVNVDLASQHGIQRAERLGFIERIDNFPNLVLTVMEFSLTLSSILTENHRGRLVTMFRDPIERTLSLYNYVQRAKWEPNFQNRWADMSLTEFIVAYPADNYYLRFLLGFPNQEKITWQEEHLIRGKEILRQKALVLLTSKFDESVERMSKYFGWDSWPLDLPGQNCYQSIRHSNQNPHPALLQPSTDDYNYLIESNRWDSLLYEYAVELFDHQRAMFDNKIEI